MISQFTVQKESGIKIPKERATHIVSNLVPIKADLYMNLLCQTNSSAQTSH